MKIRDRALEEGDDDVVAMRDRASTSTVRCERSAT